MLEREKTQARKRAAKKEREGEMRGGEGAYLYICACACACALRVCVCASTGKCVFVRMSTATRTASILLPKPRLEPPALPLESLPATRPLREHRWRLRCRHAAVSVSPSRRLDASTPRRPSASLQPTNPLPPLSLSLSLFSQMLARGATPS